MIDRLQSFITGDSAQPQHGRKVFRMITSDRTAGSIPCWDYAASPEKEIENTLAMAQQGIAPSAGGPQNTLAYQPVFENRPNREFGFADLVDMVNPLQHIPVVNHLYRKLTGDEIKPASKIIGATVFGGPAGFAGGMVNLIVEKETGRDITGNALALARGETLHLKNNSSPASTDLPAELLAFSDVTRGVQTEFKIEQAVKKRPVWERN